MASYQKRKGKTATTWQYTISHKSLDKPIRRSGFRTKGEAVAVATEIEAKVIRGVLPHLKEDPIDEYFEKRV